MKSNFLINNDYLRLVFSIWKNLENFHKFKLIKLFFVMFSCAFFELISLASVVPFLIYITEPKDFNNNKILSQFVSIFGIENYSDTLSFITLFFIFAVILSFFLRIYNVWLNENTSALLGTHISQKVFKILLYKNYSWHLNSNTSNIINETINNVALTVLFIAGIFKASTSILISIFIVAGLLFINTSVALIAFIVFGTSYLVLVNIVRRKLSLNGKILLRNREIQLKNLQEGFGAIRDVILSNNHKYFISIYKENDKTIRIKQAETEFLKGTPKFLIETISIILMVLIAYGLSRNNIESSGIITLLGSFALGSQRLLPAIQGIYNEWANIKVSKPSVSSIVKILSSKQELREKDSFDFLRFNNNISFNSISFKYPNTKQYIFKDVSFTISKGEKIGIIGETGAGKSTLVDLISGLLEPTTGEIFVDKKELIFSDYDFLRSWRSVLAYVPQNIYLSDASILENIAFGEDLKSIDYRKVKEVARIALVSNFVENLPAKYDTYVGERGVKLSGGQKQRIGIARALYKEADLIFFDEATSALDNNTEKELIKNIYNLNTKITLIMIAHRLTTLKGCDRIFELKNSFLSETKLEKYDI